MKSAFQMVLISLSLVAAACGDASNGSVASRPAKDSAAGDGKIAARDTGRDTLRGSVRDSTRAASRPDTAGNRTGPDSAILLQLATQPKLRTKADSISLVASIRTG